MNRDSKKDDKFQSKNILFVSSAGGHLSQLLQLKPWWSNHRRHWVTFDLKSVYSQLEGESVSYAYHPTTRNIFNMFRNGVLAAKTLRKLKPDVVISNGAGVAFPFFVVARLFRIPTVYIEVYDRIDSKTLTGRMCKPFTSEFLVQWESQANLYEGSTLVGALY